ncbi:MAG: NAD(P)-dependent dehydrogenase (short-subunit alcohol dehydrogenase family) [Halioglobus sp.]|jgi:NAD(P)-dependent dehydrogenase (short-subunit alcohol dehydrogenase family)
MHTLELFQLEGRTALVTGGGHGIGRHLSIGLAEAGADVIVVGRKPDPLLEVVHAIEEIGRRAWSIEADLSDLEGIDRVVASIGELVGHVDILVNNAGMVWAAPTLDYPMEGWDKVFDLNIRGLFYLSQQCARLMKEHGGGSIINIASISAWRCAPDEEEPVVAYNASKGAVISLTRDLGVKLARDNIRVNCIAPGPFLTSMMNHVRHDEEKLQAFENSIPQRRSGEEDDMKGVVVFLASAASAFVTGQTVIVDGGWSCT